MNSVKLAQRNEITFVEDKGKGDYSKLDLTGVQAILVTTRIGIDQAKQGDFLQECVEKGINVVITLYANANNYNSQPLGKFQTPLTAGKHDFGEKAWKPLQPKSLILDGSPKLSQNVNSFRSVTALNTDGEVDLVASYKDGKPMIAIRKDQPGLVTSLAFACGSHEGDGQADRLRVVVNALQLIRI